MLLGGEVCKSCEFWSEVEGLVFIVNEERCTEVARPVGETLVG